ncbi:rabenosyn-5 isoform X2 [Tetranychus urticae]|uniref:rabenosyn-5 isoform X2 n=1 Tax=Tetranychus urticae TaxID=32264 RepID=UPI000D64165D|nr:rabenosyn-5 isoform X2 [Tetranychus urticae]
MEGFLCPNCISRFDTARELLAHFEEQHKGETPQKAVSSLRGILDKAKKILNTDDEGSSKSTNAADNEFYDNDPNEYWRSVQACGPTRSYWEQFKVRRNHKIENCVIETNKLLIRLDKLLRETPIDPDLKKLHEKSVVEWVEDVYVNLCPQCAKTFNFSRRRHHCRLCGGIMCHNCSHFLDSNYAKQLVSPIDLETSQLMSVSSPDSPSQPGALQRRGSIISLPSIPSSSNEPQIRVCIDCKVLLDRRNQQMYEQHSRPIICQMYEMHRENVDEAHRLIEQYLQIIDSLRNAECNYKVEATHGQEVRIKLVRLGEKIDAMSRRINALGVQGDIPLNPSQRQLQSRIRAAAVNFIQQKLSGLPPIPTQAEYEKLREEKLKAEEAALNTPNDPKLNRSSKVYSGSTSKSNQNPVLAKDGWTPEVKIKDVNLEDMDPMLIQINQIKEFIDLARKANKYDEASMLEANLRELEIEYMMQSIPVNGDVGR